MTTVVDTLVVELGLDPSKFSEGANQALEALRKMQLQLEQGGKDVDAQGQKLTNLFSTLKREALVFTAALFGGAGVKAFVEHITTADASVGRLTRTMNMSAEEISSWQGVARRMGGTAEGIAGTMQGLTDEVQNFALTGQSRLLPVFNALNISMKDNAGNWKNAGDLLLDINHAVQGMDPARARSLMLGLGLDSATINALLQGEQALRRMKEDQRALNVTTGENAKQAEAMAKAWSEAEQSAESFGRKLLNTVSPVLTFLLKLTSDIFKNVRDDPSQTKWLQLLNPIGVVTLGATALLDRASGRGGASPSSGASVMFDPLAAGGAKSGGEREAYLRRLAIAKGIDPNQAVRVVMSEGGFGGSNPGDDNSSFNAFQLHYGGLSRRPGMGGKGLGDEFTKRTGLDARDDSTWRQQYEFSLDWAKEHGWGAWHGWKGLPRAGLDGLPGVGPGAGSTVNNTSNVHIDKVDVVSRATDTQGVATDFAGAVQRANKAATANTGLQ